MLVGGFCSFSPILSFYSKLTAGCSFIFDSTDLTLIREVNKCISQKVFSTYYFVPVFDGLIVYFCCPWLQVSFLILGNKMTELNWTKSLRGPCSMFMFQYREIKICSWFPAGSGQTLNCVGQHTHTHTHTHTHMHTLGGERTHQFRLISSWNKNEFSLHSKPPLLPLCVCVLEKSPQPLV